MSTRLPLIPLDAPVPQLAEIQRACQARGYSAPDIYRLLAHAPKLLGAFVAVAYPLVGLDEGGTPPSIGRDLQELVIMRVNQIAPSTYEWAHHHPAALAVGVRPEQLAELNYWPTSGEFDERERAALALTDAVVAGGHVTPEVFDAARGSFDERGLVEIALTAAFYCCVARFVNVFDLDLEDERRHFVDAGS